MVLTSDQPLFSRNEDCISILTAVERSGERSYLTLNPSMHVRWNKGGNHSIKLIDAMLLRRCYVSAVGDCWRLRGEAEVS